jgi:tetratricopeptide (TPR) repeat protein
MFVIARTSSFKYKGKEVDIRTVGRELGVRYVLEGSVRKSEDQLRISAKLVDTKTGNHLWAERYDRDLKDIFAMYDEITMKIINALQVELTEGETARLTARGTQNLTAYLNCLLGQEHFRRFTKEGNIEARRLLKEAIALDPTYPYPYSLLSATYYMDVYFQTTKSRKQSINQAVQLAQKAIALDDSQAYAHALLGFVYTIFFRQYEKGIAEGRLAIALNPNGASEHAYMSINLRLAGRYEEAVQMAKKAIRLNPFTPGSFYRTLGWAYICTGSYEGAISAFKTALKLTPDDIFAHLPLSIAYSLSGREEEAHAEVKEALRIDPNFSLEKYAKTVQYKDKTDTKHFFDALRKAGLPD